MRKINRRCGPFAMASSSSSNSPWISHVNSCSVISNISHKSRKQPSFQRTIFLEKQPLTSSSRTQSGGSVTTRPVTRLLIRMIWIVRQLFLPLLQIFQKMPNSSFMRSKQLLDLRPEHARIVRSILDRYVPGTEVWAFRSEERRVGKE